MPRVSKSNVPHERLRWVVQRAADEFGLTTGTLRKALAKDSAVADENGLFSTKQVVAAIHGALDQEKLRTQAQITRKLELQNAIAEASVLVRAEVMRGLSMVADAIKSRILSSGLSRHEQEDILKDIASIPVMLKEVGQAQTRQRVNGNGAHPEANTD
jgi:hypothetical protein